MIIILLFLSVLPLAVDFWVELPYEPIKILLIELTAIVSTVAVFVWLIFFRRLRGVEHHIEKLGLVDLSVAVWLVILALSTALSVSPYMSLWGSEVRGTGLAYYAALTAIYFIVRLAAKKEDWAIFARISCLVAASVSVYGLVQWLGFDFSGLAHAFPLYGRTGPTRAFATFGHPNFLGAYLAMFVPFGVYVWLSDRRRIWRYIAGFTVMASGLATLLTYSRGAWLAYAGGLALVFLLWKRRSTSKIKLMLLGGVVCALLAAAVLFSIQPRLLKSTNSFAYRIGSSVDLTQGSVLARLAEWRYAASLMPERPILGYGLDTYVEYSGKRVKSPLERNRDWVEADPSVADRLHNFILDIGWSTGLVGLAAYGFLLYAVFQRLRKLFKQHTEMRHWLAVLSGSLFAYLVSNLTGFDFSISGLWFYLILGAIMCLLMTK